MNKTTLFACAFILLAAFPVCAKVKLAEENKNYDQRNVKEGERFSVEFDYSAGTAVNWYVLEPLGPGIKIFEIVDMSSIPPMESIKALPGIQKPMVAGGPMVRKFIFVATVLLHSSPGTMPHRPSG